MSTGCKSSHNGFLDVSRSNGGLRISGCIGQLSCLTIFSTSLSVAAFLHSAGGLMLESTNRKACVRCQLVPLSMTWNGRNTLLACTQQQNVSPMPVDFCCVKMVHIFAEVIVCRVCEICVMQLCRKWCKIRPVLLFFT